MKTVLINDESLLGKDLFETKINLLYLKHLQKYGYQIILMSKANYNEIKNVGVKYQNNEISLNYLNWYYKSNLGINFNFYNQDRNEEQINFLPNYLILGGGVRIRDNYKIIKDFNFIDRENIVRIIDVLDYLNQSNYSLYNPKEKSRALDNIYKIDIKFNDLKSLTSFKEFLKNISNNLKISQKANKITIEAYNEYINAINYLRENNYIDTSLTYLILNNKFSEDISHIHFNNLYFLDSPNKENYRLTLIKAIDDFDK